MAQIRQSQYSLDWDFKVYLEEFFFDSNFNPLSEILRKEKILCITTPTVNKLYGSQFNTLMKNITPTFNIEVLDCSEETKDLQKVITICNLAQKYDLERKSVIIAFGGGVCSDLVTVAASWIRRGIPYIKIPTTLIGQIDAGIGIKGAVNFNNKKSYLGCFFPPKAVIIAPQFLSSLDFDQIKCGFAEIIKMALVSNAHLFELVESHAEHLLKNKFLNAASDNNAKEIIRLSAQEMLRELEANFYENKTYKRLVDFGHTISPLIEVSTQFALPHGKAVAIDIAFSSAVSNILGHLTKDDLYRIMLLLKKLDLPTLSHYLDLDLIKKALKDAAAHRDGNINFVIPSSPLGKGIFIEQLEEMPSHIINDSINLLKQISFDLPHN